jgi:hypothetical protein
MDNNAQVVAQLEHTQTKNRWFYLGAGAILALTAGTVLLVIYWAMFPLVPLQIKEPLVVVNEGKRVENGGTLLLEAEFCKNTDAPGDVEISLIGKNVVTLQTVREGLKAGCYELKGDRVMRVELPVLVNLEPRRLHYKVCYQLNPIRHTCKEFDGEVFEIVEDDPIVPAAGVNSPAVEPV